MPASMDLNRRGKVRTAMANAYLQLANLLAAFAHEGDGAEEWERDKILLHVFGRSGSVTTISDLLRTESFGTLPTLQKRLRRLIEIGLASATAGKDKRTRVITLTAEGLKHLNARGKRIRAAVATAG